ncbi:dicarboxylate/amino acid:cation symporter [Sporomusa sphaeroides]|uniref:Proton/sodium-glutamate symport protein n=1 Tax=Sporomusa sphaeroides DSM 2875 TaxID=1337886 RepID=A0ABM9W5M3_9FIRM|nr:dicarboxylate/amino acid:cation symporter [Sporomusa sphaeroides]OLS55176.1 proton/sodium-glutamate symport protein [Sporomusa sphaeroides DSM 2875]CVK20486.1 Proton/sodium-glutamate symport protein [Sporomusa sphaeroides DSM 2875]
MKLVLKDYLFSIILLASVLIGGAVGVVLGPEAAVLKPLGDLFLNLLFMIIVPMVFFSIASAIASMGEMSRLGKIMGSTILVFFVTALIAAVFGLGVALLMNPTEGINYATLQNVVQSEPGSPAKTNQAGILGQLVQTFTVSDFPLALSKSHILPLIVLAALTGLATALVGEAAKPVAAFLAAATQVMMKVVQLIMYYAPIGLGAYFANVVGELGTQILQGYLKTFITYLVLTVIYYFGFFTLYAYVAAGKKGVKAFWRNALAPSVTAIATCSSAASIPINLVSAKAIGVPKDMVETVIPLGANIHKDGSVFGGVLKIVFLFGLFGMDMSSFSTWMGIVGVSFLVGAVMGAIPGGGMIGEMLIISVYGFSPEVLPIIAVISTIIDAPATLLNSTGNVVCSMLIARLVEGKKWLTKTYA